jgi:predicted ATPase/DNA-binding SARP family transcriptional activator/Flp pilus assembly protein TadD
MDIEEKGIPEIHLFGAFQVSIAGKPPVRFATQKAQALLAYLLMERYQPHRRESLASLLWAEQPEGRARQNLRQALLHLRQALAPRDDLLIIDTHTVRLNPAVNWWCDGTELENLTSTSRSHDHRSLEQCLPCLHRQEQICTLYKGEFLQGFSNKNSQEFDEWILVNRERAHNEALQAMSLLADYYEKRGDYEDALQYTRRLVQLEPWREEAHRQLMRLLAYNSQYSIALTQFKQCQQAMQREFGVAPTRETIHLFEQIHSGNCTPPVLAGLIPTVANAFIGRETERRELAEVLAKRSCRLISLVGPGGVGKTRLALQTAREQLGLHADGVYFIPLMSAENFTQAMQVIVETLQVSAAQINDPEQQLIEHLRSKHLLLVLDNFEHLIGDVPHLSHLLAQAPGLQLLITSRERLLLQEEWVLAISGLQAPDLLMEAMEAQHCDAVQLFSQRALQHDHHFQVNPDNLPAIICICRLLEGSALGIELAAASVSSLPCEIMADSLTQSLDNLSPALRNLPERHRSLRAVFDQSWLALSEIEQGRLAMLTVFHGSFHHDAAASVTKINHMQLASLSAKSLLRFEPPDRYAFHAIIHEFARQKLAEDPINQQIVEKKHAQYFAALAKKREAELHSTPEVLAILMWERPNLLAAWHWSLGHKEYVLTAELLNSMMNMYLARGPLQEGCQLLQNILLIEDVPPSFLISVRLKLARLLSTLYEFDTSLAMINDLLAIPAVNQDQALLAEALYLKGHVLSMQGESQAAQEPLFSALALSQQHQLHKLQADCLKNLGNTYNLLVQYDEAKAYYQQALQLHRLLGNKLGICTTLNNLATTLYDTGDYPNAKAFYEEALVIYREIGELRGEAKVINNLGNVAAEMGNLSAALHFYLDSLKIHCQMGNQRAQSVTMMNIGCAYLSLAQFDLARSYFEQALAAFTASKHQQAQAEVLGNLGLLALTEKQYQQARDLLQKAYELSQEYADQLNMANVLLHMARLDKEEKNYATAQQKINQAMTLRELSQHSGRLLELEVESIHLDCLMGHLTTARQRVKALLPRLSDDAAGSGCEDQSGLFWELYQVLSLLQEPVAEALRQRAHALLLRQAQLITDEALRNSFLFNNEVHRQILQNAPGHVTVSKTD